MLPFNFPRLRSSAAKAAVAVFGLLGVSFGQHYQQKNLVSNLSTVGAVTVDSHLKNPWGLIHSPNSSWWISNNNDGTSTLYDGSGNIVPLVVTVPSAAGETGASAPTGVVFNGGATDFLVAPGKRSIFIFVTEDGTISGWNPGIDLNKAVLKIDNSKAPNAANGAVYKGATIAEIDGRKFLLAANFRSGKVEVYDSQFKRQRLHDAFGDDNIPQGFAPFNVQAIGPNVYVTYAKQDSARHDPIGGDGLGFVDVFSTNGRLLTRLQHGPWLDAPWGVVLTPGDFGEFSHTLLVGNFRSGWIAAFNPVTGRFLGFVKDTKDSILTIDGLWALQFGNSDGSTKSDGTLVSNAGSALTLFFTAGPNQEHDGLFGTLTPVAAELNEDDEQ